MKKLFSILLVFSLIFTLVACSNGDEAGKKAVTEKKPVEKTAEQLAEETVDSFMGALINFEFDKLKDYVTDKEKISEKIVGFDVALTPEEIRSNIPEELVAYAEEFEAFYNITINKIKEAFAYEIKQVEKSDEDTCIVTVEITVPNTDSVDIDALLADKMSGENVEQIITKLSEEGKITETTSQEEVMGLLVTEALKIAGDTVNEAEFETSVTQKEFVVVKTDNKWLIDSEKSNLE